MPDNSQILTVNDKKSTKLRELKYQQTLKQHNVHVPTGLTP